MGSMKKTASTTPLLFEDKPLFGLDIGRSSARVVQVMRSKGHTRVHGYGEISFDPVAIEDGVIKKHETIAAAIQKLFAGGITGSISTNRTALSVPIAHTYTRYIEVPKLSDKELAQAVKTEVEQYIPALPADLFVDYMRLRTSEKQSMVLIIAVPKKIIESYLMLMKILGLEAVLIFTSSDASANLFSYDSQSDLPAVLVDFGSDSADITIYDKVPIISGTVACGGEQITQIIMKSLGVTEREAMIIKSRYGLGFSKKQKQIVAALDPVLEPLIREIRRTVRYYEERSKSKKTMSQVMITGGGANMPGIADYLTSALRLPVRSFDPTAYLDFGRLQPFSATKRMSYVTATGLSLFDPKDIF